MSMRRQAIQYGQRRLTRKLSRSLPWIGGLLALATVEALTSVVQSRFRVR